RLVGRRGLAGQLAAEAGKLVGVLGERRGSENQEAERHHQGGEGASNSRSARILERRRGVPITRSRIAGFCTIDFENERETQAISNCHRTKFREFWKNRAVKISQGRDATPRTCVIPPPQPSPQGGGSQRRVER